MQLPGLSLWLAPNRSPRTLNAGAVSQWDDISGNGNHVTQATATLQPVLTRADNLENRILYSEQFDDATWSLTEVTVSADVGSDPNGGTTADKIVPNTNNTTHTIKQDVSVDSSTEYTFSVVAEANGYDFVILIMWDGSSNIGWVGFNLATGAIASTTAGTGTITDLGSGLYRCEVKATTGGSASTMTNTAYVGEANSIAAYVGDGTSGINLWGAQVVPGAFVGYAPTEAVIAYPGVNGLPGLKGDAVDDVIQTSAAFNSAEIFGQTKKTMFVVFKTHDALLSNKRIFVGPTSGNSSAWGIFMGVNNVMGWKYRNGAGGTSTLTGSALSTDTTYVLAMRHDGASVKTYVNSLSVDVADPGDGRTTGETSTLGVDLINTTGGVLTEAIVSSGAALSDAQFNQTMTYLAVKYGVTLS